jgi:hypothetical protein
VLTALGISQPFRRSTPSICLPVDGSAKAQRAEQVPYGGLDADQPQEEPMSNLTPRPWARSALAYSNGRDIAAVYRSAEVAEAQLDVLRDVTQTAITEALMIDRFREMAEQISPMSAPLYRFLTMAAVQEMAEVIADTRGYYR